MTIPSAPLNILTFPQQWNGPANTLDLNVLILPKGDPAAGFVPAFPDATLTLNAHAISGLDQLPVAVPPTRALTIDQDPADRRAFFDELLRVLNLVPSFRILPSTGITGPRPGGVRKLLTESYRQALRSPTRRTDLAGYDSAYECVLREDEGSPPTHNVPPELYWPELLSFVLRQPELARKIGLLYRTSITFDAPAPLTNGGYLYADLGIDSDYAATARQLFAARVPPLLPDQDRAVFAAVLFPVGLGGNFDDVFPEAELYDDGFAKLVHGAQPRRAALLETSASTLPAVKDVGIRLAWDDEQVAIWLNRQLGFNAIDPGNDPPASPLGVGGYRVDVFDDMANAWQSLVHVSADNLTLGDLAIGPFDDELAVEVIPVSANNQASGAFWLPSYFAAWAGGSLAVADETPFALAGQLDQMGARPYTPVGADAVPLRYGQNYRFRVRLMDLTGGGPSSIRDPLTSTPASEARVPFRRFVPPREVRIAAEPVQPIVDVAHFEVARPQLGYPDVVFTGKYADPVALLLAQMAVARAERREPMLADPDVTQVRIDVQVRTLSGDPAATAATGLPFMPLYSAVRDFPADFDGTLGLDFAFRDVSDVQSLAALAVGDGALPLPRARDVRVVFTAVGTEDPLLTYWGAAETRVGAASVERYLKAPALDERALFVPQAGSPIQAIFLQPDIPPLVPDRHAAASDLVSRLAHHVDLPVADMTFGSPAGKRVVYACSGALRHTFNPDASSITFSSKSDLTRHWIVALQLTLDRDWTWDGLAPAAIELQRQVGDGLATSVATVTMPRVVNPVAVGDGGDRRHTDLVIFDAFDPKPAPGVPLVEPELTYTLVCHYADPATTGDPPQTWTIRCPITTPPAQVPRIVSAGFAFSEYQHDHRYSSTEERRRRLYFELDGPPVDVHDRYYARVLAYGPDPLLFDWQNELPSPPEPPLPIDPEPIRHVQPGQPNDRAGLNAMVPLTLSPDSDRHYVLELPDGIGSDDPRLFGFFVYELRVGHDETRWCTAQGRWGTPLRITGVQHPAPQLRCSAARTADYVVVSAPFAMPVVDGMNARIWPRTRLYALLYAQVLQADGASWRNVLLQHTLLEPRQEDIQFAVGLGRFSQDDILRALRMLGLKPDAPLSTLCVETLPEPNSPFNDPVGHDLGQVRFLRTSTLTAVPEVCPPEA